MAIIKLQAHLYPTLWPHTHAKECIASDTKAAGGPGVGVGRAIDHLAVYQVAGHEAEVELGLVDDLHPDAPEVRFEHRSWLDFVGPRLVLCLSRSYIWQLSRSLTGEHTFWRPEARSLVGTIGV